MESILVSAVPCLDTPGIVAPLLFFLRLLLYLVAIIYVISGIDDLFIDTVYWGRWLYRRIFVLPKKHKPLTVDSLIAMQEKAIAVMIPAWDESAVIGRMLDSTLSSLDYRDYHVFVGTYPNDEATQREVLKTKEKFDNIELVVCPHNGPTNKADCLNWIYHGIRLFEQDHGKEFAIFVMDDSEDVVHPLALKLFNYLIPRKDVVQLPVFALQGTAWNLTAGHYADEFADNHMKLLLVREVLAGSVPSAGVGCAFSRHAMTVMAKARNNLLFNTKSLTEDYEFTLVLNRLGLGGVFVKHAVEREGVRRSFLTGRERPVKVREYIAIREHFPSRFHQSVRQKTRWIIGITLQAWDTIGWEGDLWTKYMLFRDRKTLLTSQANMWGYVALAAVCALAIVSFLFPDSYRYPQLVEKGTFLWKLILASTFFLFVRIAQRFHSVLHVYGPAQAALSIPRLVWGNFINFFATMRAIRFFLSSKVTGKSIAWDKTDHVYPTESELLILQGHREARNSAAATSGGTE